MGTIETSDVIRASVSTGERRASWFAAPSADRSRRATSLEAGRLAAQATLLAAEGHQAALYPGLATLETVRLGWFLLVVAAAGVGGWLLTRGTRWLHYTFVAVIVVAAFAFGGRGGPPGERAT